MPCSPFFLPCISCPGSPWPHTWRRWRTRESLGAEPASARQGEQGEGRPGQPRETQLRPMQGCTAPSEHLGAGSCPCRVQRPPPFSTLCATPGNGGRNVAPAGMRVRVSGTVWHRAVHSVRRAANTQPARCPGPAVPQLPGPDLEDAGRASRTQCEFPVPEPQQLFALPRAPPGPPPSGLWGSTGDVSSSQMRTLRSRKMNGMLRAVQLSMADSVFDLISNSMWSGTHVHVCVHAGVCISYTERPQAYNCGCTLHM